MAVEPIDPRSEPKPAAVRSIDGPKVCLASLRDGWQVQLRSDDADWTRIDGTVEVVGGEIERVSGFADLETESRGRKTRRGDQGTFNKRQIEFKVLVKEGGTDTFRFSVNAETQALRFRFRFRFQIANKAMTDIVRIGKEGKRPSRVDFSLDAHPELLPVRGGETPKARAEPKSGKPRKTRCVTALDHREWASAGENHPIGRADPYPGPSPARPAGPGRAAEISARPGGEFGSDTPRRRRHSQIVAPLISRPGAEIRLVRRVEPPARSDCG